MKILSSPRDPDILKTCPVVKRVIDKLELLSSYHTLGMEDTATVDGKPAYVLLWRCAAAQVAEAERLMPESKE